MNVSVNLLGQQRLNIEKDQIEVQLKSNARVLDLFLYIQKSYPEITLPENALLVTVNEKASHMNETLKSDDNISFLPLFGGG